MPKLGEFEPVHQSSLRSPGSPRSPRWFCRLQPRVDAAHRAQERRTPGGAYRSVACEREASVAASLGGAVGVVGQSGSEVCTRLGHAQAGAKEEFLLDRGRYRISEKRSPFGGSSPPVLRAVGQAGQLSGGGESVVVHRAWQCADRLAAVLAGAMG